MAKIIYEPHPLNAARKARLQAQGYKIIDAIFAPAGTPLHQEIEEEATPVEPEVKVEAEDTLVAYEAEEEIAEAIEKLDDAVEEYIAEVSAKRGRPKKG